MSEELAPMKEQVYKDPRPADHFDRFHARTRTRDQEASITANTVLGRGGSVVMYWGGGRSRPGQLSKKAKRGIGRLALETGAPIVPIAIYGSQKARNWKRLQFPKVTVQYGEPMLFEPVAEPTREQQQAVADEVFARIRRLYAELERVGRKGMVQRVREQRRAERRSRHTATA